MAVSTGTLIPTERCIRAVAALLLLVSIAADLAADSRCHPLADLGRAASVEAVGAPDDPCGEGCVSDCYCCSVVSPTSIFRLGGADCPFVVMAPPADPAAAPGVPLDPYRPPLPPL